MLIGALSQFSISNLYISSGNVQLKMQVEISINSTILRGWSIVAYGSFFLEEILFVKRFSFFNLFEILLLPLLSRLIVKRNNSLALPEIDLEATNIFLFFSFLFFSVYLSYFQLVWQYKKRPPIVSLKFAVSRDCNFGGTSSWSLLKNCPCNCL